MKMHMRRISKNTDNTSIAIAIGLIAIALAVIGWSLPLISTSDPFMTSQCMVGYFATNATEVNGTLTLSCNQVGWTQLTGYPSPCAANNFVIAVGASLTCTTVQWANLTAFPSGCSTGRFVTGVGIT